MSRRTTLGLVGRWSTLTKPLGQEPARRNAMAASTALAARRLERLEVEEFVAAHLARQLEPRPATEGSEAPVAVG
jgi:hypothetical protein